MIAARLGPKKKSEPPASKCYRKEPHWEYHWLGLTFDWNCEMMQLHHWLVSSSYFISAFCDGLFLPQFFILNSSAAVSPLTSCCLSNSPLSVTHSPATCFTLTSHLLSTHQSLAFHSPVAVFFNSPLNCSSLTSCCLSNSPLTVIHSPVTLQWSSLHRSSYLSKGSHRSSSKLPKWNTCLQLFFSSQKTSTEPLKYFRIFACQKNVTWLYF